MKVKQERIVISATGEESKRELIALKKKINKWRIDHKASMYDWALKAHSKLEK